ncbi:MAG: hypothetical protein AAGH15_01675 [Myxococcota bacterium]
MGESDDVSVEELEQALADAVDASGHDQRLSERVARMSPAERLASETNLRDFVTHARASLERATRRRGD